MSIITWEPRADITQFRHQFDTLFDSFFGPTMSRKAESWNPICKSSEDDKSFAISIELPGVDEKDIAVQLAGSVLTITANRAAESKGKDRSESFCGRFERSMTLPESVDLTKIEGSYGKGLLTIKLPKLPQAKAKNIPIAST